MKHTSQSSPFLSLIHNCNMNTNATFKNSLKIRINSYSLKKQHCNNMLKTGH